MHELGLNIDAVVGWFPHQQETPFVLVKVAPEHAGTWASVLSVPARRCYVSDHALQTRQQELEAEIPGTPEYRQTQIIAALLPGPGSTMAGDFGEIIGYFYQAARAHPNIAFGPKKWRLKQDGTKPAPYSDVVQFVLPTWPVASEQDEILCAEVKVKSTAGEWSPIDKAIEGCTLDRTSRLAKTLQWLKARAIIGDLGDVQLVHLNRFINATDHPPAKKYFRAMAVICSSLVDAELKKAPLRAPVEFTLVVISVPNLHTVYNAVFGAAKTSTSQNGDSK